jgi:hypothetical protein
LSCFVSAWFVAAWLVAAWLVGSQLLFRVRSLAQDGTSISLLEIDLDALGASRELPYDIDRYFIPAAGAELLPVADLVTIRARPQGIANAAAIMRAAYAGQHPRRAPIAVRPFRDGDFLVKDGNSTVLNAIASGWPRILCLLEDQCA